LFLGVSKQKWTKGCCTNNDQIFPGRLNHAFNEETTGEQKGGGLKANQLTAAKIAYANMEHAI
jgi:hypothetical protein